MKKILFALMALVALVSCSSNDEPFTTATATDFPRFIAPSAIVESNSTSATITRDQPFKYDFIIVPVDYVDVKWTCDGQVINEGQSINQMFLAGTYEILVTATSEGGQSWRKINLTVNALDGDPTVVPKAKNLWCQIGTEKTLEGSNFTNITSMTIGGVAVKNFVNNGDNTVTFTVPELATGDQKVIVTAADGTQYGCGTVNIQTEEWVDPTGPEVTLWEGKTVINWGDSNVKIATADMANVPVGAKIRIYYNIITADYHAMRVTTPQWGDNPGDNLVQQFDITENTPNPYVFEYTAACKNLVDNREGMLCVGYGYEITKITYEVSEKIVWEGNTTINWGDSNVKIPAADLADVKVGSTVSLYYDIVTADYHAMRVTTPQWGDNPGDNLVQQFDITDETPKPYTFVYTEACKNLVDSRDGMLIVGYGYALKKVTIK